MIDSLPLLLKDKLMGWGSGLTAVGLLPLMAEVESVGEKSLIGVIIGGLCLFAGRYWASRPHIIAALRESRVADAALNDKQTELLINRINNAHESEVKALLEAVDRNVLRANTNEQIANVERQSKHKAIEGIWALLLHQNHLNELLRKQGVSVPVPPDIKIAEWQEGPDQKINQLLDKKASEDRSVHSRKTQQITVAS